MEAQRRLRQKRYRARTTILKNKRVPRDVSFLCQEDITILAEQGVEHGLLTTLADRANLRAPPEPPVAVLDPPVVQPPVVQPAVIQPPVVQPAVAEDTPVFESHSPPEEAPDSGAITKIIP